MSPSRTQVVLTTLLFFGVLLPLPGASAAGAPPTEALRNGSLEGLPGAENGFELLHGGAETAVVARDGVQSVNLARAGAAPQTTGVLGGVMLHLTHPVELRHLVSLSYSHSTPRAPPPIQLVERIVLDKDRDGVADGCLARRGSDLATNSGWATGTYDASREYVAGDAACPLTGTTRAVSSLQADPEWRVARILHLVLETTTSEPEWGVAPVYVDAVHLLATSSPLVRIRDDATNLCDGASFTSIPDALPCAADGATILVAPGVHVGTVTVPRPVTICGTALNAPDCVDGRTDVVVRGTSAVAIDIASDGVTIRGLTIENPGYAATDQTAGGPVTAVLVRSTGSQVRILGNTLRDAAADLLTGQSRAQTLAIQQTGGTDVRVEGNAIASLPASLGRGNLCANLPCLTTGIHLAGVSGSVVRDNVVDMSGTRQARGIVVSGSLGFVEDNDVSIPGEDTGLTKIGVLVSDLSTALVANNTVGVVDNGAPDYGIRGIRFQGTVRNNVVTGAMLEGLSIINTRASGVRLEQNRVDGSATAIRASGNAILTANRAENADVGFLLAGATARTITLRENVVRSAPTLVSVDPAVGGATIDARENDWGVYDLQDIEARVVDAEADNAIDLTCYIDSDGATRICPPLPSFSWSPSAPLWGRTVAFTDASVAQGRPIAARQWSFGDGDFSDEEHPTHAYALPGVYDVTLLLTDGDGTQVALTQPIEIVNHAPAFEPSGPHSLAENQTLTFSLAATDADGDEISYSATALPDGAVFDATSATLTWTPAFTQSGNHTLGFAATDSVATGTLEVAVGVAHVNAPPFLHLIGNQTVREGDELRIPIVATDPDPQRITLVMLLKPSGASFVDHGDGTATFTWRPTLSQAGTYAVRVEARDGLVEAHEILTITVLPMNRAPVIAPIANQTVQETHELLFVVSALDADGDSVTMDVPVKPQGALFEPSRNRFRWTPSYEQEGLHRVVFNATDGNATSEREMWIDVTKRNRAPFLNYVSPQSTLANRTWLFQVSGGDPDGDPVHFGMVELPENATFNNDTRVFTWRPSPDQVGTHFLPFTVDDGEDVTVAPVRFDVFYNEPPRIALNAPARVEALQPVAFSAAGTYDPDSTAQPTYEWDFDASDGIQMQSRAVSPTYTYATSGPAVVTLRAKDIDGFVREHNVTIEVDDALILRLRILEAPADATTATLAEATLELTDGSRVADTTLRLTSSYQPSTSAPKRLLREFSAKTDDDGRAVFFIPRDTSLVNLPGRHVLDASASIPTSRNGDEENTQVTLVYGILLG